MTSDPVQSLAVAVRSSKFLLVLTGAGVSAESGVPTFRGQDGLWNGRQVEDVASRQAFDKDPGYVWNWYHERRTLVSLCKPNPGHLALAELEQRRPKGSFALVTQNVDGLHQTAGSEVTAELHGSLWRKRCDKNEEHIDEYPFASAAVGYVPTCNTCGFRSRPDVVWFGEQVAELPWQVASLAIEVADLLLVVGTSAEVFPSSFFPERVKDRGSKVVVLNVTETLADRYASFILRGSSGELLPRLLKAYDQLGGG